MRRVHLQALAVLVAVSAVLGSRVGQGDKSAPAQIGSAVPARDPGPRGAAQAAPARRACPPEMVQVDAELCIDRWEMSLEDARTGRRLSPHYHPRPALAERDHRLWSRLAKRVGSASARAMPLPELPAFQLGADVVPRAVSAPDRVPNAYLDMMVARDACAAAGKRLCRLAEWLRACRGDAKLRHGYGERYDPARCNLAAGQHPANLLHGSSRSPLTDPRLNLVEARGKPLLEPTGALLGCATAIGDDGVYDMIGNLDEWVDDPAGTFVGGFYARDTQWGCDARIETHSADYYDYSTGARCCRDAHTSIGATPADHQGSGTPPAGRQTK